MGRVKRLTHALPVQVTAYGAEVQHTTMIPCETLTARKTIKRSIAGIIAAGRLIKSVFIGFWCGLQQLFLHM